MSIEAREERKPYWDDKSPEEIKAFQDWLQQYAEEALEFAKATQDLDMHLWPEY
jgi:hypothetical protein